MFFRFSHRDKNNDVLRNLDQLRIVDEIMNKIETNIANKDKKNKKPHSATYLKFFDLLQHNFL